MNARANRWKTVLGGVVASALLIGCATEPTVKHVEPTLEAVSQNPLMKANRSAAMALIAQVKDRVELSHPLIIATVVDINVLERSSTLGRVLSEQVAGAFSQAGFKMIEMKFRESVYMKRNEGELMLTRELRDVAKNHNAQAVIVGTYGVAADMVLVNLKVVQVNTNIVLAVHDYVLPLDKNARAMLRQPVQY
jgi:TolB-like protein